jgi:hypothetical protein
MVQDEVYWKVIPVTTIGIMFLTTFGSYATTGIACDVRMSHIFHDNESCRNTGILTTLGIFTMCYGQLHNFYDAIRDGRILYLVICLLCNI